MDSYVSSVSATSHSAQACFKAVIVSCWRCSATNAAADAVARDSTDGWRCSAAGAVADADNDDDGNGNGDDVIGVVGK